MYKSLERCSILRPLDRQGPYNLFLILFSELDKK